MEVVEHGIRIAEIRAQVLVERLLRELGESNLVLEILIGEQIEVLHKPRKGRIHAVFARARNCAIIGGNVYRGAAQPVLRGGYVFSDACTGMTWAVNAAGSGPQALVKVADGPSGIAGYGEDEAGELYAADLGGRIYRVTATSR